MLESGTLIYAVPEATSKDESFAGWYYDAELKKPAQGSDAVEKNLTLYPAFGPIQNFEDDFRINYMSALDVEPDFPIEIVAYGLTEEQIREKLKVTNLSKVNGAEEYVFERLAPDMKALIPDEKTRSLAEEAAGEKAGREV